jgi:hypothetical protein
MFRKMLATELDKFSVRERAGLNNRMSQGLIAVCLKAAFQYVLRPHSSMLKVRAAAACAKELAINNLKFAFLTAAETAEAFDKVPHAHYM